MFIKQCAVTTVSYKERKKKLEQLLIPNNNLVREPYPITT